MKGTILKSNVSAISWKAGKESSTRTYKFSYNALAWLTAATYSGTGNYTTQYTYDKMGNFQTLKRYIMGSVLVIIFRISWGRFFALQSGRAERLRSFFRLMFCVSK